MELRVKGGWIGLLLFYWAVVSCPASTTMQIVCDNDYALLVGNSTSVTRVIYQNDVVWNDQIAALSSFTFDLQAGETTLYLVAMGGGGAEDIGGTINDVNITSISSSILESSDISSYLTDYADSVFYGTVENGTYSVNLVDIQAALDSGPYWFTPDVASGGVAGGMFGSQYSFDNSTAVIFAFDVTAVNVPEPSVSLLLLAGGGVIGGGCPFCSRRPA